MGSPSDRRYSESHEWHQVKGNVVTLGISQFAANQLTDITYVEMQPVGTAIEPGGAVGEVESVKATSEIYSAVGGKIVEVNTQLSADPGLVNRDPFDAGWLCRIEVTSTDGLDGLMDSATYDGKYAD